ncbi:MAG: hypothetical protein NTZ32_24595 [Planctomycetales bacterium]|nr:hypothetical protein [Planctomycetales bacterium]
MSTTLAPKAPASTKKALNKAGDPKPWIERTVELPQPLLTVAEVATPTDKPKSNGQVSHLTEERPENSVPATTTADSSDGNDDGDDELPAMTLTPEAIVTYAREADFKFFQDQYGSVFAWVPTGEGERKHNECLRIRSRSLLARLLELIKYRTKSMPQLSTLKQAIEILELEAFGSPKKNLDNRRVTVGDETFIDLGDENWRMVRITRQGWEAVPQEEARFFRPQHVQALPEPIPGGNLDDLSNFVPTETKEEKLLLTAWLLGGLYPAVPNPIMLLTGQQGSAKTTRSRRLRSLLDPSLTPVLGDLEMSNLFLTFQHHAVPCFENVSSFKRREADMFCRAVTGNGVERRKLYTDSDQVLYSFRRPIIINGIDTPSTRPDFLDRCLILNCRRMQQFTTLEKLDQEFEAARPKLFGAMLDLLVKTLAVLPTTPSATEFRMADFARFGRAVALAQGLKAEDFDEAYRMNLQQQNFEVLEDAPMARIMVKFTVQHATKKPWEGTGEDLLAKLQDVAHVMGDKDAKADLPKSARWLSTRLGELAPALASRGVYISKHRTNAKRLWTISSTIPVDPNAEVDDIIEHLAGMGEEGQQA